MIDFLQCPKSADTKADEQQREKWEFKRSVSDPYSLNPDPLQPKILILILIQKTPESGSKK